jgi:hypothetical protein
MLDDANYNRAMEDHFAQRPAAFRARGGYPHREHLYGRRA